MYSGTCEQMLSITPLGPLRRWGGAVLGRVMSVSAESGPEKVQCTGIQAHHDIAVCHSWEIQVSRSASRRSGEPRMFWILDYHLIQNELVPSITVSTGHNGPSVAHLGAARARPKASKLPEWYHTVSGGGQRHLLFFTFGQLASIPVVSSTSYFLRDQS